DRGADTPAGASDDHRSFRPFSRHLSVDLAIVSCACYVDECLQLIRDVRPGWWADNGRAAHGKIAAGPLMRDKGWTARDAHRAGRGRRSTESRAPPHSSSALHDLHR